MHYIALQEIAYKEKRAGDARDSWYIREGFEGLLEEGLGKHYPPGEALQADAEAKDRAKVGFLIAVFMAASMLIKKKSCFCCIVGRNCYVRMKCHVRFNDVSYDILICSYTSYTVYLLTLLLLQLLLFCIAGSTAPFCWCTRSVSLKSTLPYYSTSQYIAV